MTTERDFKPQTSVSVERAVELTRADLADLCDATDAAILDGNGFGWLRPPPRRKLETYWRGVLVVPERELFIGRLDAVVAASAQLVKPTPNQESCAFAATLTTLFVAPWARGYGLARGLLEAVERAARGHGFEVMNLDVRETQEAAIALYESRGYRRWGTHPSYARVDGRMIAGHYYCKRLA
ncbi:MAG: GNAT family N-acetyltransferase [Alphaproteobacteria bacterium]